MQTGPTFFKAASHSRPWSRTGLRPFLRTRGADETASHVAFYAARVMSHIPPIPRPRDLAISRSPIVGREHDAQARKSIMIAAERPFWDQVVLSATPPLVTAVFGLLLVGLGVDHLTRVLQDRRAAGQLKYDLISRMTEVASTILHYSGMYREARTAADSKTDQQLAELRKKFLEQFAAGR
jgi:hypothetical protein